MVKKRILFFADRLPPLIGGMEMHAAYFIKHFTNHPHFPLIGVITKTESGEDILVTPEGKQPVNLSHFNPSVVFFNSGRWIEDMSYLRQVFSKAFFIYRTGGNEIVKAPLTENTISDHVLRQCFWAKTLSESLDLMVTNSAYTEKRLQSLGVSCPFFRSVGGVNTRAIKAVKRVQNPSLTLFSAARFVPYKNHVLLLNVIDRLIKRGIELQLRLAGEGPLLQYSKNQVKNLGLSSFVQFLGVLDNEEICHEISQADVYVQLSGDVSVQVPGGSYIHSEGMGRSILEALTAGTYVIAGNSGALPEIVKGNRGILIDLDHPKLIADKVEPILKSIPRRRRVDSRYCWSKIFKNYETLFGIVG